MMLFCWQNCFRNANRLLLIIRFFSEEKCILCHMMTPYRCYQMSIKLLQLEFMQLQTHNFIFIDCTKRFAGLTIFLFFFQIQWNVFSTHWSIHRRHYILWLSTEFSQLKWMEKQNIFHRFHRQSSNSNSFLHHNYLKLIYRRYVYAIDEWHPVLLFKSHNFILVLWCIKYLDTICGFNFSFLLFRFLNVQILSRK